MRLCLPFFLFISFDSLSSSLPFLIMMNKVLLGKSKLRKTLMETVFA